MPRDLAYLDTVSKVIEELVTSRMTSRSMTLVLMSLIPSSITQACIRQREDSQGIVWERLSNSHFGMKKKRFLW